MAVLLSCGYQEILSQLRMISYNYLIWKTVKEWVFFVESSVF